MSCFYTEGDIVTYQNNMIIYMWNRKETIIPEKQITRKPEKNLGFTSKFASPDWTMLITSELSSYLFANFKLA